MPLLVRVRIACHLAYVSDADDLQRANVCCPSHYPLVGVAPGLSTGNLGFHKEYKIKEEDMLALRPRLVRCAAFLAAFALAPCALGQEHSPRTPSSAMSLGANAFAGCYPFVQPSLAELRGSSKKVFAWYFPPFPLSIHNETDDKNWYERWLNPDGGAGEYRNTGGSLRDRPLWMPKRPELNWKQLNFEVEIRQAIAMGLDGFILEMSHRQLHPDDRFNRVRDMLAAAQAVDPEFRIMLAPGFPKEADAMPDELAATLLAVAHHPSVFRLPDGRLPMATFYPERPASSGGKPIEWWKLLFDMLQAEGVDAAWYPMFLSRTTMNALPDLQEWYATIDGYSRFDGRWVSQASSNLTEDQEARSRGLKWMARAVFQDVRVRKGEKLELRHWESSNSATLRAFFENAIQSEADWLTVITWNDYSETQTAPSRDRGYAVTDLMAYYTTWFKTGAAPSIDRDALYYFHRKHHTNASYDQTKQTAGAFTIPAGPPGENNVELLAFLTAPGELVIRQGTDVRTMSANAGITSFKVPLVPGTTPQFELSRQGQLVESLASQTPIEAYVDYQDMTYYAGGSIRCERPL